MATTKLKGNEVTLRGTEVKVGDVAPVVTVVAKDLSDVQVALHIDFQRVSAKEKLTIKVPLRFVGAEDSDAVKVDKCLIGHIAIEIEITCRPADLPEAIEVDLSKISKGHAVHLSHVVLPKGVTTPMHGGEDPVIATATPPKGGASEEASTEEAAPGAEKPAS